MTQFCGFCGESRSCTKLSTRQIECGGMQLDLLDCMDIFTLKDTMRACTEICDNCTMFIQRCHAFTQRFCRMHQQPVQHVVAPAQEVSCTSEVEKKQRLILPKIAPFNASESASTTECTILGSPATKRDQRMYKCAECAHEFNAFRQLRAHEKTHAACANTVLNICTLCCSLCASAEALLRHQQDSHADGRYTCPPCGKHYKTRGHLFRHVQGSAHNSSALLYYCTLCPLPPQRVAAGTAIASKVDLQQHFQQVHQHTMETANNDDDVDDLEMNEEFLDDFFLGDTNENSFQFSECWDALDLTDMLHLDGDGDVNSGSSSTHANVSAPTTMMPVHFKCPKCFEDCANQKVLLHHLATKHALNMLICSRCELSFNDLTLWRHHKAAKCCRSYDHNGVDKQCGVCDRSFKSNASLGYHLKTHFRTKSLPHECPYCGKRFHTDANLKQHLRVVHSQLRRHVCQLCDKQFATLDHLKKHVLSQHQNERRHSCHICAKNFTQLCHLKQHMAIHTTGKTVICALCLATFWRKIDLERHTLTKHNTHGS